MNGHTKQDNREGDSQPCVSKVTQSYPYTNVNWCFILPSIPNTLITIQSTVSGQFQVLSDAVKEFHTTEANTVSILYTQTFASLFVKPGTKIGYCITPLNQSLM